MSQLPQKLKNKLEDRKEANALRKLSNENSLIDFSSNDYLGFAKLGSIFNEVHDHLVSSNNTQNGSGGSRLLSGNHSLYEQVEKLLCKFHKTEAALVFNSGYDANIGFFSSVPQRGDIILYDELIHASIRDGIKMSNARAYKFKHNSLNDIRSLVLHHTKTISDVSHETYLVTESVFSMDGDSPNLTEVVSICKEYNVHLIVDEAHAIGVLGNHGIGLVQQLSLQSDVFARLVTFGKAMGCHGAAILGSNSLKRYLVNYARSFIYTTALPPHSLATIKIAYEHLTNMAGKESSLKLRQGIQHFKSEIKRLNLHFIPSDSAIHCCIVSGNENVKIIAQKLQKNGFDVKPILSPTVPLSQERLRFCLHAYNSKEEITNVLEKLATFVEQNES